MAFSKSRSLTLLLALASLSSNLLFVSLLSHLSTLSDPYNLTTNYSLYLHFAGIVSVFGVIGTLREHALSLLLFSNYLVLDTILSSIPRLLLLTTLSLSPHTTMDGICDSELARGITVSLISQNLFSDVSSRTLSPTSSQVDHITSEAWSGQGCTILLTLLLAMLFLFVCVGTILQFVGALYVRGYALSLSAQQNSEPEGDLESGSYPAYTDFSNEKIEGPRIETIKFNHSGPNNSHKKSILHIPLVPRPEAGTHN